MPKLSRLIPSGWPILLLLLSVLFLLRLPDTLSFLRLNLRGNELMHQQVKGWLAASPSSGDQAPASRLPGCDQREDPKSDGKLNNRIGVRFHRFSFLAQFLCGAPYESLKQDAGTLQTENPEDGTVAWLLAKSAFAGGYLDEARRILRSASLDESILAYTFAEEAYARRDPGRAADILDLFGSWKAEPVVTERARLYDLACSAYRDAGRPGAAISACIKLVTATSGSSAAWLQLARAYLAAEEYVAAAESAEKAVALKPNDAWFLYVLARSYDGTGLIHKAEELYRRVLYLDPAFDDGRIALALNLAQQRRCDEAADALAVMHTRDDTFLAQLKSLDVLCGRAGTPSP
jgi:tetratricopeptide (TPR) repeat protein